MHKLNDINTINIPSASGVYKLFHLKDYGLPYAIQRLLGCDRSGLLYIGETVNLKRRIKNLKNGIEVNNSQLHCLSKHYNFGSIKSRFPIHELYISWSESRDHKKIETEELKEYMQEYGELPPFNFKRPPL